MRQALLSLVLTTLAGFSAAPAFAAKPPVVVELFTAQGCSSCGKANQVVADMADDKGVLALTYSVDYWDYLGWTDTFAKPAFAARQRAYAQKFSLRDVPTPQVVVAGREQASGAKAEAVETLVKDAAKAPSNPPDMEFVGDGAGSRSARPPRRAAAARSGWCATTRASRTSPSSAATTAARPWSTATSCANWSAWAPGAAGPSCTACPPPPTRR
jgi:hypothetical protein